MAGDEELRDFVRGCAERLRDPRVTADPAALTEDLVPLSRHVNPKIRQAVAEACEVLPESLSEMLLGTLLSDTDRFVVTAAERSRKRCAARKKARVRARAENEHVEKLLAELETKHSKGARRLAERAVQQEREHFVRKLQHEVVKIATSLEGTLRRISADAERPTHDGSSFARHAIEAQERLTFLLSTIDSAVQCTKSLSPTLRAENAAALVDEACDQLVDRLRAKGVRVALENDVDPGVALWVDRHLLLQAMQNVLQNGVEATASASDGAVRLRVTSSRGPRGSDVTLAFRDFGCGIADVAQSHLFVLFGSQKKGGTGVGLFIARRMVEEVHGGELAIESTLGEGTTVSMTLPTAPSKGGAR